jgi:hypothetical protein
VRCMRDLERRDIQAGRLLADTVVEIVEKVED